MSKLKRWSVVGIVKGSKFLGVFEAETQEQAEAMAVESDKAHVHLCHQCAEECEDGAIEEAIAEEAEPE